VPELRRSGGRPDATPTVTALAIDALELPVRFGAATSLALELDFDGKQPRHFGAPAASSAPFRSVDFNGEVVRGASCNCRSITLVPHCNGTHTEGVGHLTLTGIPLHRYIPPGPIPALLLTIEVTGAPYGLEDTDPPPRDGDRLLTRAALLRAWPASLPFAPRALLLRTAGSNGDTNPAPFLTRQATMEIVARGIEHLVVDLPSVDRSEDEGRLTAHRIFFGLPVGSVQRDEAARPLCTITELAHFPVGLVDGPCALQLQLPAFTGDAVPSRPLHLPLAGR
jgi:kynurenine formamidase